MSAPAWLVLAFLGLVTSARTRVTVPVLGPTPVLGLVALAVVLALADACCGCCGAWRATAGRAGARGR